MSEAIKKITTYADGNTLVTVKWGNRTFIVEVGSDGVVVAPVDKKGNINKQACPSAWVDPFIIKEKVQLEDFDKGEAPLLIHAYFDNENEGPVTVRAYKKRGILTGDGLPFVEK